MSKKLLIIPIIIILLLVSWLIYFKTNNQQSVVKTKNLGKIVFGWNTWPGMLPYLVAYDQGFFKAEGLEIELKKEDSYSAMFNDLLNKKIDFSGDVVLLDVVENVEKNNNLKVVAVNDYSNGADGIVVKKEITDMLALRGKTVAVEQKTFGEYLLYVALQQYGLTLNDVIEVNYSASESAQAFIEGKVDAAVTSEPNYSEAVVNGNGYKIFTSAQVPGMIVDLLVFNKDYLNNHEDQARAVLRAYFKAIEFIKKNQQQSYAVGAKYFNITTQEFTDSINGVKLNDLNDNIVAFSYRTGLASLYSDGMLASDFLLKLNKITNNVDSTEYLEPKFIKELNK